MRFPRDHQWLNVPLIEQSYCEDVPACEVTARTWDLLAILRGARTLGDTVEPRDDDRPVRSVGVPAPTTIRSRVHSRRAVSAEARARMSAAAFARWARQRAERGPVPAGDMAKV
jgi:hypothetical protein